MNRFFLIFYILGLLGCSVVLAEESIFRVRLVEDLGTLDWGYGEVNAQVVDQLMEGLTFVDRRGNATPAVARKWVSTGNITQFFLRSDAKWSDGRRVCAEDFEIAWQRIREAQIVSPYSHLFKDIQAVRAKSCEKLEVETKTPLSYLPELLSHWVFYPVQKNSYQKQRDKFFEPENLISNGPYKIKKWHKDSRYVLEKNEYYFAEKARPLLLEFLVVSDDQTALTLYKAGKIDWLKDPPILSRDQIVRSEGFRVFPTAVGYHLGFSFLENKKSFDRNARCAISKAIDVTKIPKILFGTEIPSHTFVPPQFKMEKANNRFSKADAQMLWSKSTHPEIIEISYYAKQIHETLMQWIQAELAKNLNTKVVLNKMESKTYWSELANRSPSVFLSGTTAYFSHAAAFLDEMRTESPANWGKYSNKNYDRIVDSIKKSNFKRELIAQADRTLVHDDCSVIPLYFRPTALLLKPRWINFELNPLARVQLKKVRSR